MVATEGGFAKRTRIEEYPAQGRGGKGVLTARIVTTRGGLVGAIAVSPKDEIYAITSDGVVIRTQAAEVRRAQRQTMGVRLMNLPEGVNLVAIARNADEPDERYDMTQPPDRGSARHDADRRPVTARFLRADLALLAGTVRIRAAGRRAHDGAVDTSERRGVDIDESRRRRRRPGQHLRPWLGPDGGTGPRGRVHAGRRGLRRHRRPSVHHLRRARGRLQRPTAYDDPGQYGLSGRPSPPATAPAGAPATTPPRRRNRARSGVGHHVVRAAARARGPRRARLQLRHINPWTVLKFSCVLAIALFFVWLLVVGLLYGILDAAGVIGKINDAVDHHQRPGLEGADRPPASSSAARPSSVSSTSSCSSRCPRSARSSTTCAPTWSAASRSPCPRREPVCSRGARDRFGASGAR